MAYCSPFTNAPTGVLRPNCLKLDSFFFGENTSKSPLSLCDHSCPFPANSTLKMAKKNTRYHHCHPIRFVCHESSNRFVSGRRKPKTTCNLRIHISPVRDILVLMAKQKYLNLHSLFLCPGLLLLLCTDRCCVPGISYHRTVVNTVCRSVLCTVYDRGMHC